MKLNIKFNINNLPMWTLKIENSVFTSHPAFAKDFPNLINHTKI